jgi:hypothetical protein
MSYLEPSVVAGRTRLPIRMVTRAALSLEFIGAVLLKPMILSFRAASTCRIRRADPQVRAGRPRPALLSKNQVLATIKSRPGGPAAGEGARPPD